MYGIYIIYYTYNILYIIIRIKKKIIIISISYKIHIRQPRLRKGERAREKSWLRQQTGCKLCHESLYTATPTTTTTTTTTTPTTSTTPTTPAAAAATATATYCYCSCCCYCSYWSYCSYCSYCYYCYYCYYCSYCSYCYYCSHCCYYYYCYYCYYCYYYYDDHHHHHHHLTTSKLQEAPRAAKKCKIIHQKYTIKIQYKSIQKCIFFLDFKNNVRQFSPL